MFKEDKTYETPIGKLSSVTTILGIIKKPFMEAWIKKTAREATIEAVWEWFEYLKPIDSYAGDIKHTISIVDKLTKERLREIITESVKAHEKVAQKALDIGSFVHDITDYFHKSNDTINNCIKQTEEKLQMKLPDEEGKTALKMIDKYFEALDTEKIEVIKSEMMVWHECGYAGTLDRIAKVNGDLAVVDLKTSKNYNKGKYIVPLDYRCQIEAYRRAYIKNLERNTPDWCPVTSFLPIEKIPLKRFLFRLDKENPDIYDFVDLDKEQDTKEKDWQVFLAHKMIYDAQKEMK